MERKPTAEVRIRPYEREDKPRVQWLFERTPPWGRTYPRPQPLPEELERPDVTFPEGCFVALEDDIGGEAVVGFCAVSRDHRTPNALPEFLGGTIRRGRVCWVSVAPERWRLGIGRRLTQTAIDRLLELGCASVVLETTVQQEGAIALYESMGFVECGRAVTGEWHQVWLEYGPA